MNHTLQMNALGLLWAVVFAFLPGVIPSAAAAGGIVRLTTTADASESNPAFIDGPRIACLRTPRNGEAAEWRGEIWTMRADGREARRILGPGCFRLRVSAGRRLWMACARYVNTLPAPAQGAVSGWEASTEIWAMPAAGSRPLRLAGPGSYFLDGWGANGRLYLHEGRLGYNDVEGFYEATGFPPLHAWYSLPWIGPALYSLTDSRQLQRFCDRGPDREQLVQAGIWAPDGSGCIRACWFQRNGKRWIGYDFNRQGQPPRRILETEEYLPSSEIPWIPAVVWIDSRRVLLQRFVSIPDPWNPQGKGRFYLVLAHPDSGAFRVLDTEIPVAPFPRPVISPSGDWILFRAQPSESAELWIAPVKEGKSRSVLGEDAGYTPWAWSPDGRSLVVARQAAGGGDLWRIDLE